MKNKYIYTYKHTNLHLLLTRTHAQASVTGLFSSPVFRVYSWSCVCDPSRCSRSNVRLPFHLRVQMCAHVCGSHCLRVRHTQPDLQRWGRVYKFWSISAQATPKIVSLVLSFYLPVTAFYIHINIVRECISPPGS